jgi:hypothetical protein
VQWLAERSESAVVARGAGFAGALQMGTLAPSRSGTAPRQDLPPRHTRDLKMTSGNQDVTVGKTVVTHDKESPMSL